MINFRSTTSSACRHEKILPEMKAGYCPDCGEYVENHWYISRCGCCGMKQKASIKRGKVFTDARFCRNCGHNAFSIIKIETIDIVNINYAVVIRQAIESKKKNLVQTWIEENYVTPIRLLTSY